MIILKANYNFTKSQIEEIEKDLSEKLEEKVCIIPHGFDIVELAEDIENLKIEDNLLKDMVDIEEEQGENKTDLVINVRAKTDEESFEIFKRKLIELKEELRNKKEFRILTKDSFIEWYLCKDSELTNSEEANRVWEEVRKEYNFVILAGEMIYSVSCFDKMFGE